MFWGYKSCYEETVYILNISPQKFLVLNLSTLEEWKAEFTLEPPRSFENGNPRLVIQ